MAVDIPRITIVNSILHLPSQGTDKVRRIVKAKRIAFNDFDNPSHHIAIVRKANCATSPFHTPIEVCHPSGKTETVFVNKSSFRNCFSHSVKELKLLAQFLPEHRQLAEKAEKCSTIIRGINERISEEDIIKWIVEAERQAPKNPKLISNKDSKLGRSLLLSPSGNYVLLTKTKEGDMPFGNGSFKTAKPIVNLGTGEKQVVAVARKKELSDMDWAALQEEIRHMEALKGKKGIVQINTAVTTPDKCYIVMEYCDRGTLFDSVATRPRSLTRQDRLQIARDCATGLRNMHALGLLNRDIKMQNIFLYTDDKDHCLRAKIGDLGLACKNDDHEKLKKLCGTEGWVAPEIAKLALHQETTPAETAASRTSAIDVWALGSVYYNLLHPLGHCLPHQAGVSSNQMLEKTADLKQEDLWETIDRSGIDPKFIPLIKHMLHIDPKKRPTMEQVQQCLQTIR